ncbi:hypothetical protein KGP36_08120 [Patescibacteria group bacterium]|nr:hypothetical protein [Patescibacteria group bacterium]
MKPIFFKKEKEGMKRFLFVIMLVSAVTPAIAKDYTILAVTNLRRAKPYYFSPDHLAIQPGDSVTFVDAQNAGHDIMFDSVPKGLKNKIIVSPMLRKKGERWSHTFTVAGSYHFHCHPHEAFGMEGTLIVGHASLPGNMQHVSHKEMESHMSMLGGM